MSSKSADVVTKAMTIEMLVPFKRGVHAITTDNGREFEGFEQTSAALNSDIYSMYSYCLWEWVIIYNLLNQE